MNKSVTIQENRTMDDHMLVSNGLYIPSSSPVSSLVIKGNYIPSPSPAPPTDGSYFNMSDKYLSYPPIVSMFPSNFAILLIPPQRITIPKMLFLLTYIHCLHKSYIMYGNLFAKCPEFLNV